MVCQAQSRLEDKRPHNIQHLGILGGTRTLAGREKPVLAFTATGYTRLGWSFREAGRRQAGPCLSGPA